MDGPALTAERLTKHYPRVTALDELTLRVEPGVIGLIGANGAGKSTLIKILLGLLRPTRGQASVLGFDVASEGSRLRQYVGYMPEHECLPPDVSATELVSHLARTSGLPVTAARERTADILRHVGLYEARYRPVGDYSTGMRQRVKLAQALVHDPRLVFLDEPTNGLDPAGRDEMLRLIHRVGTEFGISVVLASHLLGEIERICDHVVVIDAGRLLRSSAIDTFTQAGSTLAVEVEEGQGALAERLAGDGFECRADGRLLLVRTLDADTTAAHARPPHGAVTADAIRDATAELDLSLVRLERRRQHIEDIFRERMQEDDGHVDAA